MPGSLLKLGEDGAAGQLVKPSAGAQDAPLVVLLPAIAGVNDYVLNVAQRLADRGIAVLALDYFARRGGTPDLSSPEKIMAAVGSINDDEVLRDTETAIDQLGGEAGIDGSRAAVLGLCLGGSMSLMAGSRFGEKLRCTAAFYGLIRYGQTSENKPRSPIDTVGDLSVPFVGHWGDADHLVPEDHVHELRAALKGKPAEVYLYPGAGHAFHEDFRPPVYRPVAAAEAWERTLRYFDYYLVGDRAVAQA
jgi:carboxymethylenebutenolidase